MDIPFDQYNVRIATPDDYPYVVDVLTQSFRNDLQMNWILDTKNNPNALEKAISLMVKVAYEQSMITITEELDGVAIWELPTSGRLSFAHIPKILSFIVTAGFKSLYRIYEDKKSTEIRRPDSAHYYLAMLAVLPQAQGKGVASRMMNPVVSTCKAQKMPIYLETGNPKNVEIYKKKGFSLSDIVTNDTLTRFYMNTEINSHIVAQSCPSPK
ncbi:GNAT family N-acetyltransferase [Vibrio sp. DNB22_10_4]